MAKIQGYDNQKVKNTPIGDGRLRSQASAYDFGAAIGRGIQSFGANVEKVAVDIYEQSKEVEVSEREIQAKANIRDIIHGQDGYLNQNGKNASEQSDSYKKKVEDVINKSKQNLNSRQIDMLEKRLVRHRESAGLSIDRHNNQQTQKWQTQVSEAVLQEAANDASINHRDINEVNESLSRGRVEILKMAEREGWANEHTKMKLTAYQTSVHSSVLNRMLEESPENVNEYMNKNRKFIDTQTLKSINNTYKSKAKDSINSIRSRLSAGFDVPEEEMQTANTWAKISSSQEVISELSVLKAKKNFADGLRKMTPKEVSNAIQTDILPSLHKEGASNAEYAAYEIAQKVYSTMDKEIKSNPLEWGARVGLVEIEPLDLASTDSVRKRRDSVNAVSKKYDTPRTFFTTEEKRDIQKSIASISPDKKVQMAAAMQTAFGDDMNDVMAELSEVSPKFAYSASLAMSDAPNGKNVSYGILSGEKILKDNSDYSVSKSDSKAIFTDYAGGAFKHNPIAAKTVKDSADSYYIHLANQSNPSALTEFDEELYQQSIREVIGGNADDKWGETTGIGEYNGMKTLLPEGVNEDSFEESIERMNFEDMLNVSNGVQPVYSDGSSIDVEDLKDHGVLESVGGGAYRVWMDGLNGYATDINGNYFVMKLDKNTIDSMGGRKQ